MREQTTATIGPETGSRGENSRELEVERNELMAAKKEHLAAVKAGLTELFGAEKLPEELAEKMIEIRKKISAGVRQNEYLDRLDTFVDGEIRRLFARVCRYREAAEEIAEVEENGIGDLWLVRESGEREMLGDDEKELLGSLRRYFESYRLVKNAGRFRKNLRDIQETMAAENKDRKLNFYSAEEKEEMLTEQMMKKYEKAGFTEEEIGELVRIGDLKKLNDLEIHEIRVFAKIKDIFARFMRGDKTKYVGLSAALMIPSFLEGYAPMFLANAFRGGDFGTRESLEQIGLYALLSTAAAGSSALFEKMFKKFLDENYGKEGGFDQKVAKNTAELPANEVSKFGAETIKRRIAEARESYETVMETISFSVLPAVVTMATSAVMLAKKNPYLAAGTVGAACATMALDRYILKKGKFWQKEGKTRARAEETAKKMEEQLSAHMEIALSGEKEKFSRVMEDLLSEDRVALSDRKYLWRLQDRFRQSVRSMNLVIIGLVSYLAGGGADKFIAGLVYSGNFDQGISNLLSANRSLQSAFRDIRQMEIMFNGYAEEEAEKEKDRIGADRIEGGDIRLRDISVEMGKKKILDDINLDIPAGSMVNLSGASGAGKTTLMKVITGYYRPAAGSVELGGVDVDKIKKSGPDSIYGRIAYLSQFPYILRDSVRNNLAFGAGEKIEDAQIREVLRDVGLEKRFGNLDEMMTGGRGDSGAASGGETSRLGLARALLKIRNNDCKVVFLDEPTASVDKKTWHELAGIIKKEKQARPGTTFIVIDHNEDFVRKLSCDIKLDMSEGKLSAEEIKPEDD